MKILRKIITCVKNSTTSAMPMSNPKEIFSEIDKLSGYFRNSKSYFRYIGKDDIGKNDLPPFIIEPGLAITMHFDQPIDENQMQKTNTIGHYLNQNFLIRLCAVLEAHHVVGTKIPIEKKLVGADSIRILRMLRNRFAHSSGNYNNQRSEDRRLRNLLLRHYNFTIPVDYDEFPINQDKVIFPMVKGIKDYILNKSSIDKGIKLYEEQ